MSCQSSPRKQLAVLTSDLIQDLNNFKMHRSMAQNGEDKEEDEILFVRRLLSSQMEKIQVSLMRFYDYLEENQMERVKNVIAVMFQVIKEGKYGHDDRNFRRISQRKLLNYKNSEYCQKCFKAIQKGRLAGLKIKIGMTEALESQQRDPNDKISIKNELSDDGFLQNFNIHIANIDCHLNQLMRTMEKEIFSKVYLFLSKDKDIYRFKESDLEEDRGILAKDQQQFKEIEEEKHKLTDNFMSKIKIPICDAVTKILRNIQRQKARKRREFLRESSTQTTFSTESQMTVHLEERIENLSKELVKLRTVKCQADKEIVRYMESEGRSKSEIIALKTERAMIEQRLRKEQINYSILEQRYKSELSQKQKELEKLTLQLRLLKNELTNTKHSIKQKKGTSHRIIEKELTINLNATHARPSVDLNLSTQDMLDLANHSRFKDGKKTVVRVNNRSNPIDFSGRDKERDTRTVLKSEKNSGETAEMLEARIREKIKREVWEKSRIVNQFVITIEPRKQQEDDTVSKVAKKRTLRILKPNRRQMSLSKNKNLTLNTPSYFKQNPVQTCFSYEDEKPRLRTEISETSTQLAKMLEKMKNGSVSVRNLKSRGKENQEERVKGSMENLPEIGLENLMLFGGQASAMEYEKNMGIWPHLTLADKLAVDLENAGLCQNIQRYFKYLKQTNQQKYSQYTKFLTNPLTFLQLKRKNRLAELPEQAQNSPSLKQCFTKLIRFHKIVHKNCNHVTEFLEMLRYSQT